MSHGDQHEFQFDLGYANEVSRQLKELEAELQKTQRDYCDLRDAFDKLRKEYAELQIELRESQWLTKRAVEETAALKSDCETEIALRALAIQKKNEELADLKRLDAATMEAYNANLLEKLQLQDELNARDVSIHRLQRACAAALAYLMGKPNVDGLKSVIETLEAVSK